MLPHPHFLMMLPKQLPTDDVADPLRQSSPNDPYLPHGPEPVRRVSASAPQAVPDARPRAQWPEVFSGRFDHTLGSSTPGERPTTTSRFMLTPFFMLTDPRCTITCLVASIIRMEREVNDSASFLFHEGPARIQPHEEHLHHGAWPAGKANDSFRSPTNARSRLFPLAGNIASSTLP